MVIRERARGYLADAGEAKVWDMTRRRTAMAWQASVCFVRLDFHSIRICAICGDVDQLAPILGLPNHGGSAMIVHGDECSVAASR